MMSDSKKQAVKVSDIRKFLTDPFQFYVKGLFGEKWGGNVQKDTFEPVEFDNIVKTDVSKKIIRAALENTDIKSDDMDGMIKEIERKCVNLPDGVFLKAAIESVLKNNEGLIKKVKEEYDKNKFVFDGKCAGLLKSDACVDYEVWGDYAWYNKDWENGNDLYVFDYSHDCLKSYITALCLIAFCKEGDESNTKSYNVSLNYYGTDPRTKANSIKSNQISLSNSSAKDLLSKIFKSMYVDKYRVCVPYSIFEEQIRKNVDIRKYGFIDFVEKMKDCSHGPWAYFDDSMLFDPEIDCGYKMDDFAGRVGDDGKWILGQWEDAVKHQTDLIVFLKKEDNPSNQSDDQAKGVQDEQ